MKKRMILFFHLADKLHSMIADIALNTKCTFFSLFSAIAVTTGTSIAGEILDPRCVATKITTKFMCDIFLAGLKPTTGQLP